MEELLNQTSVEITRDRTVQIFISKIDLDYAYGQMKISNETSRQCVFALTEQNLAHNIDITRRERLKSALYLRLKKLSFLNMPRMYS